MYRISLALLFVALSLVPLSDDLSAAPQRELQGTQALETSLPLSCSGKSRPFKGIDVQTRAETLTRYMMLSAYNLEPYSRSYIENTLIDLARHGVAGILYSSLGGITRRLQLRGSHQDEYSLNRSIFGRARELGASIWLQVREFDNSLVIEPGSAARTVTAEEILSSQSVRQAYFGELKRAVEIYEEHSKSCVVVMFEEAGIYHSPQGGGTFWSSQPVALGKPSAYYDQMFADRMVGLFAQAKAVIKSVNLRCSVGMHLGHSVFLNKPVLRSAMAKLASDHSAPDFILYDFYLKAQKDFETYQRVLTERARFIRDELGVPPFHLAQLHTMNNFQHGSGKTPSRSELDRIVELSRELGFRGLGFYTKNATPTAQNDNDPLSPNTIGQATVYQSAKDRWDYGLLKLNEMKGLDFRGLFDVVLLGSFPTDDIKVEIGNQNTAGFDLLGYLDPSLPRPHGLTAFVFRELEAKKYIMNGITIRLTGSRKDEKMGASLKGVWITPSEPSKAFRGAAALAAELRSGRLPNSSAGALRSVHLSADAPSLITLCLN